MQKGAILRSYGYDGTPPLTWQHWVATAQRSAQSGWTACYEFLRQRVFMVCFKAGIPHLTTVFTEPTPFAAGNSV